MTTPCKLKLWMSRGLELLVAGALGFAVGATLSGSVIGGLVLAAIAVAAALPYVSMVSRKP